MSEQANLEKRLEELESKSGISVPRDELRQRIREIMEEFSQGG
ncbi:hypothetical protein ACFLY3_02425 [Chloroflexota bacterium]